MSTPLCSLSRSHACQRHLFTEQAKMLFEVMLQIDRSELPGAILPLKFTEVMDNKQIKDSLHDRSMHLKLCQEG